MKRRTPLRKRNPERSTELYERNFGEHAEWIREQRCCLCSIRGVTEPHHAKSRGAGGDKRYLVPLCRDCHRKAHEGKVMPVLLKLESEFWWKASPHNDGRPHPEEDGSG